MEISVNKTNVQSRKSPRSTRRVHAFISQLKPI
jgi:hypothetical protein